MENVSSYLLRVTVTGHHSATPESTDSIGVLHRTRAIIVSHNTFISIVIVSTWIMVVATMVDPSVLYQIKVETHHNST